MAAKVLDHCASARGDRWKTGSMAEAKLILGDSAGALALYGEAMAGLKSPREIESMLQQGLRLADLLGDDQIAEQLHALYRGDRAAGA